MLKYFILENFTVFDFVVRANNENYEISRSMVVTAGVITWKRLGGMHYGELISAWNSFCCCISRIFHAKIFHFGKFCHI